VGQQVDRFGEQWRAPLFQMRGIGQSEPVERLPTLEEQADDIATVMDAVGLTRAQIMGTGSTAPGAVVFAAGHPDRVDGLVLLPRLSDRLIVTAARRAPRVLTALNRLDAARSRRRS
jgi:pimeloyl-ACP methyl ester carboxylesterase